MSRRLLDLWCETCKKLEMDVLLTREQELPNCQTCDKRMEITWTSGPNWHFSLDVRKNPTGRAATGTYQGISNMGVKGKDD